MHPADWRFVTSHLTHGGLIFKSRIDGDPTLGGAAANARLSWAMASAPEYVNIAGSEARRFPVLLTCALDSPNPQASP
jgi:hypothetical protein